MSKPKFTPGPWERDYKYGFKIRKFWVEDEIDLGGIQEIAIVSRSEQGDDHANAHLIAAAPELYAVCDEIREAFAYFSEFDLPVGFEDRLNAALKKARGER